MTHTCKAVCSKSTMETPEDFVKSVQSYQGRHKNDVSDVAFVSLLSTLRRFHKLLSVFSVDVELANTS